MFEYELYEEWLKNPNPALRGQTPEILLGTSGGSMKLVSLLNQQLYGMPM